MLVQVRSKSSKHVHYIGIESACNQWTPSSHNLSTVSTFFLFLYDKCFLLGQLGNSTIFTFLFTFIEHLLYIRLIANCQQEKG